MFYFFLIGLFAVIWAVVYFAVPMMIGSASETDRKFNLGLRKVASVVAVSLMLLTTAVSSYYGVDTGNVGVARTFGKVDTTQVYQEGAHWLLPWQTMFRTDNRTAQTALQSPAESASKDMQVVHTNISLNWHLQQDLIPIVLRDNGLANDGGTGMLTDKVLVPAILETFKAVISKYTAEELVTKRAFVSTEIANTLAEKLKQYHIIIEAINVTNFQFSDEFNKSIELKVTAAQKALQAEADLRRIKTEALQVIAEAQGKAEAIRIQAKAINAAGGKDYVDLKAIEKWNGVLPTTTAGGAVPFLNLHPAQ